ncbi:peptidase family C50-domain-containing protein [Polychytrium aggregatum]|uniref:peptidase family C50-domain-containing protein n=1 Tax=Polychytrium aggregatum TaxID=110093 RepID=UPI0022FE588A|nr:peptidase family C50-domain-containing protein [Polychytrium aggregatum]KAI9208076.1 peptidase family C50-domain-containing protein [Polychytrium aggregatum]
MSKTSAHRLDPVAEDLLRELALPDQLGIALTTRIWHYLLPLLLQRDAAPQSEPTPPSLLQVPASKRSRIASGKAVAVSKPAPTLKQQRQPKKSATSSVALSEDLKVSRAKMGLFAMNVLNQNARTLADLSKSVQPPKPAGDLGKTSSSSTANTAKAIASGTHARTLAANRKPGTSAKLLSVPSLESERDSAIFGSFKQEGHPQRDCLGETTLLAIQVLMLTEPSLSLARADLLKAFVSVALKFVDLNMTEPALRIFVHVKPMLRALLETGGSASPELEPPGTVAAQGPMDIDTPLVTPKDVSALLQPDSEAEWSRLLDFCCTAGDNCGDASILNLVSNFQHGAAKILLSTLRRPRMDLLNMASCVAVCDAMLRIDLPAGQRICDGLYRLLFNSSLKIDQGYVGVLQLRAIALQLYVRTKDPCPLRFHDNVFKFGANFERAATSNPQDTLRRITDFYRQISDMDLPNDTDTSRQSSLLWREHYIYVVKKLSDVSTTQAALEQYLHFAELWTAEAARIVLSLSSLIELAVIEIRDAADPKRSLNLNSIPNVERAVRAAQEAANEPLQNLARGPLDASKVLMRSADALRRLLADLLKSWPDGSLPQDYRSVLLQPSVAIFDDFATICDRWIEISQSGCRTLLLSKVAPSIAEGYISIASLSAPTGEETERFLTKAEQWCRKYGLVSSTMTVSAAYYNLGGKLYNSGEFDCAARYFQQSCSLVEHVLRQTDAEAPTHAEMLSTLLRRRDALVSCYLAVSDHAQAQGLIASILESTGPSVYERLLATTLSGALRIPETAFIVKLVEKHTKSVLIQAKAAASSDVIEDPDLLHQKLTQLRERYRVAVAELELQFLPKPQRRPESGTSLRSLQCRDAVVSWLLSQYTAPSVQRAACLIESAKIIRLAGEADSVSVALQTCESAIDLLKSNLPVEATSSSRSHSDVLACAYVFKGVLLFESASYQPKPFKQALKIWQQLLQPIPARYCEQACTAIGQSFRDIEASYAHLHMLSEYFDILKQPLSRILSLRLALKLNNLRASPSANEAAQCLVNIGYSYLELGYTGRAGAAFADAKELVDAGTVAEAVVVYWKLCYCFYLVCIGNAEKSRAVFDTIESQHVSFINEPGNKIHRLNIISFAYFVRGHLAFAEGKINDALYDGTNYLWALSSLYGTHELSNVSIFKEALSKSDLRNGKNAAQQLMESYSWLGRLHVLRGSVAEAEYYYKRGLELAEKIQSRAFVVEFLGGLAELDCKRERFDESRELIAQTDKVQQELAADVPIKDGVLTKIREGDLLLRTGQYTGALKLLRTSRNQLQDSMAPAMISGLENKLFEVPETPREKAMAKAISKSADDMLIDDEPSKELDSQLINECRLLLDLKSSLISKIGHALGRLGKIGEGEKVLIESDDVDLSGFEQAEFYATLGMLQVGKLMKYLSGTPLLDMFSDSVLALPWGVPKANGREMSLSKSIRKSIIQTDELLQDSFVSAYTYGSAQMLLDTCHYRVLLNLAKAHLTPGDNSMTPSQLALHSAFCLEFGKGLTHRREMETVLREKMDSTGTRAGSSQTILWPSAQPQARGDAEGADQEDDRVRELYNLYRSEASAGTLEFQSDIVERLPDEWVVVSLSVDQERHDLYLSRIESNEAPVVLRLPMQRKAFREGEEAGLVLADVVAELEHILKQSRETTEGPIAAKAKSSEITHEEKRKWWEDRKALDTQLRELLARLENEWLCGFRGLLGAELGEGISSGLVEGFKDELTNCVARWISGKRSRPNTRDQAKDGIELDGRFCQVILGLGLGDEPAAADLEDIIYYLMDMCQYGGIDVDYDELEIETMIDELRSLLERTLSATSLPSGSKPKHILLILDKHLQSLPWESLPSLRRHPVSRLPSIAFLRDRLHSSGVAARESDAAAATSPSKIPSPIQPSTWTIDSDESFFVLNPGQDLKKTEDMFNDFAQSRATWRSVIGRAPTEKEFAEALEQSELFVYIGHGSGEQYVPSRSVRKLKKCCTTLLIGCSSGRLSTCGEFDPSGAAVSYLMAGCPALAANLWDVTDGDIDRFTASLLKRWGLARKDAEAAQEDTMSLPQAMQRAREDCQLPYLTGAAPVVYGVPVSIMRVPQDKLGEIKSRDRSDKPKPMRKEAARTRRQKK